MVRLQEHFPEQAEEERREALHRELGDDLVLICHRLPLPVLLLHVLLQIKPAFLWYIILLEECLKGRREVRVTGYRQEGQWAIGGGKLGPHWF